MTENRQQGVSRKTIGYGLMVLGLLLLLMLVFIKSSYDAQAAYLCEDISKTGGDMLACPAHKTDASWLIMVAFGVSITVFLVGLYLGFLEKSPDDTADTVVSIPAPLATPVDLTALDPESKQIMELIQTKQGSVFQSELARQTGFSKVKVTRILDKLEQDHFIERKRRGMANLVVMR